MELSRTGPLPRMRLTGMLAGLNLTLRAAKNCQSTSTRRRGELGPSFEVVWRRLHSCVWRCVLVRAVNDRSALGGLRAFEEAGRGECCAMMGDNASPEGGAELRRQKTRMTGSLAFSTEHYGEDLIRVRLDLLNRRPVPPAVFVEHKLVTHSTVNHFSPNDSLTQLNSRRGTTATSSAHESPHRTMD